VPDIELDATHEFSAELEPTENSGKAMTSSAFSA
jgi:hypothetical protein